MNTCLSRFALVGRVSWPHLPGADKMDTENRQLSRHFSLDEMTRSRTASRKGIDNTPPEEVVMALRDVCVQILEAVRLHYGVPIRPSSGYRCAELNKAVGGSSKSQHCRGEAVDFEIPGVSNYDLAVWISDNLVFDQLILECYRPGNPNSGWIHVSYKAGVNRNRVMTYSNGVYQPGLLA